jgi:PGAP1-like protein
MTPAELRAAGQLGGQALAGMVSRVEQVHRAVAGRAFGPLQDAAAPARAIHDAVSRGVYRTVRGVSSVAGSVGGLVASRFGRSDRPGGQASGGHLILAALAALNALAGDKFGPDLAPLTIQLAVRAGDRDVDLNTDELATAFPRPTARLAVFVHGLAETELSWHRQAADHLPYGPRLQADFGYTPVYLRYNTGRHVCDNGHDLADLLDHLLASWPVPVSDLVLVGHSMGGLVIRSACHYGTLASALWVQRVRQLFYLGSPHLGAPLARAAGLAGMALSKTAETRPFVTLVSGSSSGITDLRYGYLIAISTTITADPGSPVGAVAGDLLVQPASASGRRGGRQPIPFPDRRGLGGMHHFDLHNHPAVWAAMRDILDRAGR